jgi:hypothetical protein
MSYRSTPAYLNKSVIIPFASLSYNTAFFHLKDGSSLRVKIPDVLPLSTVICQKVFVLNDDPKFRSTERSLLDKTELVSLGESIYFSGESAKNFENAFKSIPDTFFDAPKAKSDVKDFCTCHGLSMLNKANANPDPSVGMPVAYYCISESVNFPKNSQVWHFLRLGTFKLSEADSYRIQNLNRSLNPKLELMDLNSFLKKLDNQELVLDINKHWNSGGKRNDPSLGKTYRLLVESNLMDKKYFSQG